MCISAHGIQIPSLLDSGSDVPLLRQSYFEKHLLPKIQVATSEKAKAHQLFHLMVANDGQLPVKMYTELDVNFLGLKVPNVGVLIIDDPSQVLDKKHQSKLPGIVGWNLIQLSYNSFVEQYGASGFNYFVCLEGVNPLLFSQLCVFHHSNTNNSNALGVSSKHVSQQTEQIPSPKPDDLCKKKDQQNFDDVTGHIGQVTIGSKKNPICILRNSVITVLRHTTKVHPKAVCLVEQAEHHNLPQGIVVNRCVATVKSRSVPIILINTTKQNVWLQKPLLATELYTVEYHPVEHRADIEVEGDVASVSFLPVVPNTIRVQVEQVESTSTDKSTPNPQGKPVFGPRRNTQATDFDFEAEVICLPFKLNLGDEAKLTCVQQSWFIDLIYDHPEVFSLHDEDLGFCDRIQHTIPMTMDKPVYLVHHTIPPQLQGKVHKCLDTWMQQGIIRPSQSPYVSQVVIVWKKTREICLCMDYHKLNSITVRDAFPLPRIDEALQAVHNSNWFSSFDLAQGYLQLAMEESNIKRQHLEPVQQVCTSLLLCRLDFQMLALVSVT